MQIELLREIRTGKILEVFVAYPDARVEGYYPDGTWQDATRLEDGGEYQEFYGLGFFETYPETRTPTAKEIEAELMTRPMPPFALYDNGRLPHGIYRDGNDADGFFEHVSVARMVTDGQEIEAFDWDFWCGKGLHTVFLGADYCANLSVACAEKIGEDLAKIRNAKNLAKKAKKEEARKSRKAKENEKIQKHLDSLFQRLKLVKKDLEALRPEPLYFAVWTNSVNNRVGCLFNSYEDADQQIQAGIHEGSIVSPIKDIYLGEATESEIKACIELNAMPVRYLAKSIDSIMKIVNNG